jgi:hypothetical protein
MAFFIVTAVKTPTLTQSASVCIFITKMSAMYRPHTFRFWTRKMGDYVLCYEIDTYIGHCSFYTLVIETQHFKMGPKNVFPSPYLTEVEPVSEICSYNQN